MLTNQAQYILFQLTVLSPFILSIASVLSELDKNIKYKSNIPSIKLFLGGMYQPNGWN